jgi:signal transduction histidine kinase
MSSNAGQSAGSARGGPRFTLKAFLLSPFDPAAWRATGAVILGLAVAILAINVLALAFSMGGSLLILLVGIPIIALGIEACRVIAQAERWRMTFVDGRPLQPHRYRPVSWSPAGPLGPWLRAWGEAEFLDPNRWRDVIYVLVLFPLAIIEFAVIIGLWAAALALVITPIVVSSVGQGGFDVVQDATRFDISGAVAGLSIAAFVLGVGLLPVAAFGSRLVVALHRAIVEELLCVSPTEALRQDVERLRQTRSAAVELEASELRRIERDLHDGAQQRLVRLAMDLGMAEERLDSDPPAARALIGEAREQARLALAELRDLVRGAAPAILLDRGLGAAVGSLAARCPVPTFLDSRTLGDERLPPAVERAAYFVVAEALANIAKHSGASRCDVVLYRRPPGLVVDVRDNGRGGAVLRPGGGLAGLRDRAAALDGRLALWSPQGGPTVLRVDLPVPAA